MIHDKKEFGIGLALIAGFFAALFAIFSPLFEGGRNTIDYLDGVFNAISKDSAYYIPGIAQRARRHEGTAVTLSLRAADDGEAARLERLLAGAGAAVAREGAALKVSGDLGRLAAGVLADADLAFKNDGAAILARHGAEARLVLYDWHRALAAMIRDLDKQHKFAEARTLHDIQTRAVEPAYNYYGVVATPMRDMIWVTLAALIGYVLYTVWYGYAILFLFEGWGLRLDH
jgi:hypothetical protein